MPDHSTWFRFLPFYQEVMEAIYSSGLPLSHQSLMGTERFGGEHVFHALLVFAILLAVSLVVRGKLTDVKAALVPDPKLSVRTIVEMITEAALWLMKDMMKPDQARYFLPLIGTCAFFILFLNLLGLVPGFSPPTSTLNTTVACAIVIFTVTHVYGLKSHGPKYIMHFFGPVVPTKDTPIYAVPFILILMALMFVIECISHIARPVSLSVRLMGNMFADHTVVAIFVVLVPILPVIVPLPVMLLGVFVCFVQTLVFCLLSIIYISTAIEHAEEH